jgi:hypothetical protein
MLDFKDKDNCPLHQKNIPHDHGPKCKHLHVDEETDNKNINKVRIVQETQSTMASPTDEVIDGIAKTTLYENDHELPEFVDSGDEIGSSVSATDQTKEQVGDLLLDNAIQTIVTLKQEVLYLCMF